MLRSLAGAVCGLLVLACALQAFEVRATIKRLDVDKRVVVFTAGDKDRTIRIPAGVKVLDAQGKVLPDGLRAQELKAGAAVILTVERENDKPALRAIRLAGKKSEQPATQEAPRVDTSGLKPLTDMGTADYHGFKGGLYPDGKNQRPAAHERAGLALAKQIRPLDADGKPSAKGKVVLLGVGFSNTVQAFNGFMQVAQADHGLNRQLVLVNGAVGGMSANMIQHEDSGRGAKYWATVDERLKAAGVTRAQVQAIWLKETNPGPHLGKFPAYIQALQAELTKIVQILPRRFPNLKLVYLSSRTYGGWAKPRAGKAAPGNSEPFSYETGFAVKWLIERQLAGDAALNYDPAKGKATAPWLSWGPYLWANGEMKRQDGFSFRRSDFREDDQMHHALAGQTKMGNELLRFFRTDPTSRSWFVAKKD